MSDVRARASDDRPPRGRERTTQRAEESSADFDGASAGVGTVTEKILIRVKRWALGCENTVTQTLSLGLSAHAAYVLCTV